MSETTFRQDIQQVYSIADSGVSLESLMEAICGVLSRHPADLSSVTHSYRLKATDTGYELAFGLTSGAFKPLAAADTVDVTVKGKEADMLAVFQRKLSPMKALLLGKIKLEGSKAALMKLGEFL